MRKEKKKAMQGLLLDDAACKTISERATAHTLLEWLTNNIPPEQWATAESKFRRTLLHYSADHGDEAATLALLLRGADPSFADHNGETPAHWAAWEGQYATLRLLLAAGADVTRRTKSNMSLLDHSIQGGRRRCDQLLLAHGARLVGLHSTTVAPVKLRRVELGVLGCRAVVVVLLGLKRRRGKVLQDWDRFLVREVALDIWGTRLNKKWRA